MKDKALKLAQQVMESLPGFRADIDNALDAIKEALAQPSDSVEQEPWRESASDYERGFIDGRQKQAQSSVDKAVNRYDDALFEATLVITYTAEMMAAIKEMKNK